MRMVRREILRMVMMMDGDEDSEEGDIDDDGE